MSFQCELAAKPHTEDIKVGQDRIKTPDMTRSICGESSVLDQLTTRTLVFIRSTTCTNDCTIIVNPNQIPVKGGPILPTTARRVVICVAASILYIFQEIKHLTAVENKKKLTQ